MSGVFDLRNVFQLVIKGFNALQGKLSQFMVTDLQPCPAFPWLEHRV